MFHMTLASFHKLRMHIGIEFSLYRHFVVFMEFASGDTLDQLPTVLDAGSV